MGTLWTPSGEHPVGPGGAGGSGRAGDEPPAGGPARPPEGGGGSPDAEAAVEEIRRQLLSTPADVVVANHCYGFFELAAVYLSASPPQLEEARLAIDGLAALVEGLGDRLGEAAPALREGLAQVRLAFVQIQAAQAEEPPDGDGKTTADPTTDDEEALSSEEE
ncbi:MAG TPA: hypothetical protein VK277_12705 [Acidimicrobiales bacterium]|nr:hypothetical protein [Acidimicrobiales bacterium]